jgi:hypothetical protein
VGERPRTLTWVHKSDKTSCPDAGLVVLHDGDKVNPVVLPISTSYMGWWR